MASTSRTKPKFTRLQTMKDDNSWAEQVYRSYINSDGKYKDQYLAQMKELRITARELADL